MLAVIAHWIRGAAPNHMTAQAADRAAVERMSRSNVGAVKYGPPHERSPGNAPRSCDAEQLASPDSFRDSISPPCTVENEVELAAEATRLERLVPQMELTP